MKKAFVLLIAVIATLFIPDLSQSLMAQSLLDKTYVNIPTLSTREEPVSIRLSDGSTFNGKKFINLTNGQVTLVRYLGTKTLPNGIRYITQDGGVGFDQNFNMQYNGWYYEINTNGEVYVISFVNGRENRTRFAGSYSIYNNYYISVSSGTSSGVTGGGYTGGGGYNSGGSSNSGSSSKATCRGCNGTGSCQHCHGSGYVNNYKSKCSLCHGTGRCQSCAGLGYRH